MKIVSALFFLLFSHLSPGGTQITSIPKSQLCRVGKIFPTYFAHPTCGVGVKVLSYNHSKSIFSERVKAMTVRQTRYSQE
jgi:hypothetical protein